MLNLKFNLSIKNSLRSKIDEVNARQFYQRWNGMLKMERCYFKNRMSLNGKKQNGFCNRN